jgi:sugar phosphate isomerase/epimerase
VLAYSVRDALAADQPGALARLAEAGFGAVETFGTGRPTDLDPVATATRLRRDLDAAGLTAVSAHAAAPVGDRAEAIVEAVQILGAAYLVIGGPQQVPGFSNDSVTDLDAVRRLCDALTGCAHLATAHGLQLGFHNHWLEMQRRPDGTRPYDVLVAGLDPNVDLEVDVYWTEAGGEQPRELIGQYADRVRLLHLKDGVGDLGPGQLQCPVGSGRVDTAGAIRAATHAEYAFLGLDQCADDIFTVLATGAEWLVSQGLAQPVASDR